jgi:hypothetical protein
MLTVTRLSGALCPQGLCGGNMRSALIFRAVPAFACVPFCSCGPAIHTADINENLSPPLDGALVSRSTLRDKRPDL